MDNKAIIKTLKYFSFFNYAPTPEEIHTFLPVKMSKKALRYYTPLEYNKVKNQIRRRKISENKILKIKLFVKILSWFPQIKLTGLSGSVAMMNAGEKDDIDLFIITACGRLWTGRLICLVVAQLFGLRRVPGQKNAKDKVCLNLFFDEKDMTVPAHKKNEYVAHEILQMKPLVVKDNAYERFLEANSWVRKIFPNARIEIFNLKFLIFNQYQMIKFEMFKSLSNFKLISNFKPASRGEFQTSNFLGNMVESIAKRVQLYFINRHKTSEIVTDSQLWFFPDDFEKKLFKLQTGPEEAGSEGFIR